MQWQLHFRRRLRLRNSDMSARAAPRKAFWSCPFRYLGKWAMAFMNKVDAFILSTSSISAIWKPNESTAIHQPECLLSVCMRESLPCERAASPTQKYKRSGSGHCCITLGTIAATPASGPMHKEMYPSDQFVQSSWHSSCICDSRSVTWLSKSSSGPAASSPTMSPSGAASISACASTPSRYPSSGHSSADAVRA